MVQRYKRALAPAGKCTFRELKHLIIQIVALESISYRRFENPKAAHKALKRREQKNSWSTCKISFAWLRSCTHKPNLDRDWKVYWDEDRDNITQNVQQQPCDVLSDPSEKGDAHKREANKAKMEPECIIASSASTKTTSPSTVVHLRTVKRETIRKAAFQELFGKDVPHPYTSFFAKLLDMLMHYANLYTSEMCCSSWSDFHCGLTWQPNETGICPTERVRDWNQCCLNDEGPVPIQVTSQQVLIQIAVPLLNIVQFGR